MFVERTGARNLSVVSVLVRDSGESPSLCLLLSLHWTAVSGLERDAVSLRIVPLMLTVVIKVSAYRSPPQQCPGTACLEAGSVIIRVLSF